MCGEDNILEGLITDHDIVVKVIAEANDPRAVHVGEFAQGEAITMRQHQVRRLPVIDGHDLIGIVTLADVARGLSDSPVGTLVEALSDDK